MERVPIAHDRRLVALAPSVFELIGNIVLEAAQIALITAAGRLAGQGPRFLAGLLTRFLQIEPLLGGLPDRWPGLSAQIRTGQECQYADAD